jgi:hypothetical protein
MSRTYFPTRNENGVRDLSASVTLGGYLYTDYRGPAELAAKAAMNPVNLGAMMATADPISMLRVSPLPAPPPLPAPASSSVSAQSSPTPQVTMPQLPPSTVIYVSSGGGTASPAPATAAQSPTTSTIVTAAPALTDQVAGWLGGSTPIGSWNVPNAVLAAAVVLGAAMFMGGGTKKR